VDLGAQQLQELAHPRGVTYVDNIVSEEEEEDDEDGNDEKEEDDE
jgi:hypothetical protein